MFKNDLSVIKRLKSTEMQKKTKEEKELQGTYEPSKEPGEAVEYAEYERVPTPPPNWPLKAQKIFTDRCYDLKNAGYLKKSMIAPLRRYCFAVYMAEVAERMILNDGEEAFTGKGKWMSILSESNKTIELFGRKFGFTPLDSSKIPKVMKSSPVMNLLK